MSIANADHAQDGTLPGSSNLSCRTFFESTSPNPAESLLVRQSVARCGGAVAPNLQLSASSSSPPILVRILYAPDRDDCFHFRRCLTILSRTPPVLMILSWFDDYILVCDDPFRST